MGVNFPVGYSKDLVSVRAIRFEDLCDLHVLLLSPLILSQILFIRFILYASVSCPCNNNAVLVLWMNVQHPFFPVRFRFSYVAYHVCVRCTFVMRLFYLVCTSTDSQRITILSTNNFYFHPLDVRSSYPVRCDRGLMHLEQIWQVAKMFIRFKFICHEIFRRIWQPSKFYGNFAVLFVIFLDNIIISNTINYDFNLILHDFHGISKYRWATQAVLRAYSFFSLKKYSNVICFSIWSWCKHL